MHFGANSTNVWWQRLARQNARGNADGTTPVLNQLKILGPAAAEAHA
jgi:hypothetical protein